jgi:hypothetical protein
MERHLCGGPQMAGQVWDGTANKRVIRLQAIYAEATRGSSS